MALYIAVYDIHPTDRAHLEKLLSTEDQIRREYGEAVYYDSFKNIDSLLLASRKYDLFIIDAVDPVLYPTGSINASITEKLRANGSSAPVALFFPEDVTGPVNSSDKLSRCFKKPMMKNHLIDIIDWAVRQRSLRIPKLSFNSTEGEILVTPDEVIYAMLEDGATKLVLTEDRHYTLTDDLVSLSIMLDDYPCFLDIGIEAIVNMDRITQSDEYSLTFDNQHSIPVSFYESDKVIESINKYRAG